MATLAVRLVTSLGANSYSCMFLHFRKVEQAKAVNGFPAVFIGTLWYEKWLSWIFQENINGALIGKGWEANVTLSD